MTRFDPRAVSTVLDVAICLVLVSAAALSVATAGPPAVTDASPTGDDEATIAVLATTTATVHYRLDGSSVENGRDVPAPTGRVRHGTLAELLAEAALVSVQVDGRTLSTGADAYTRAVRKAVRLVLGGRTQVAATWIPYTRSHLRGRVVVGPPPPPDATVHAATLSVSSGMPSARAPATDRASEGFDAVAAVVAQQVVVGLFPTRETRVAVHGGGVDGQLVRARFRRTASAYGSDVTLGTRVSPARADLRASVSDRIETELQREYDSPRAAASATRIERVTIVVRTWS